jgi:methylated-DNA-protein-cysteine methyltransferase-like protein
MPDLSAAELRRQRILAAVSAIPVGQVRGYGELARVAGYPRGARLVARVLAEADAPALPWHRVLRADRRIAFAPGSPGFREQRRRLQAEGLEVDASGRVAAPAADPRRDLDREVWG